MSGMLSSFPVFLRNQASHLMMDLKGNASAAGTPIWQYQLNGTGAQQFVFDIASQGGSDTYTFMPIDSQGKLATIREHPVLSDNSSATGAINPSLRLEIQPRMATRRPAMGLNRNPKSQYWRVIQQNAHLFTFISRAFNEEFALQPLNLNPQAPLVLAPYDRSTDAPSIQTWKVWRAVEVEPSVATS